MGAPITDDQKDLLLRVPDETRHEVDEDRTNQGALIELEPHEAAIAHRGDHAHSEFLPGPRQDRRLAFRCNPPAGLILVADAGLAAPMDHRLLALRPRRDRRIRSKPGRDLSRIARRRACQRFLRGETPPLQIERHRRQAERLAELLVDQLAHGLCRERQLHLIRHLIADPALQAQAPPQPSASADRRRAVRASFSRDRTRRRAARFRTSG